tara:strand:- start:131 stop:673 length:543 start_codon:yes stop_codon:yes gene_type:complete
VNVRLAELKDLTYIDHLQRKNSDVLGWMSKATFEREIPLARVMLAEIDKEPVGYLYHGSERQTCKIHQACIEYDLRGQSYGAALVNTLLDHLKAFGVLNLMLHCGSDITANQFWRAMGFYCQVIAPGGRKRSRDINVWRYDIQPALFTTETKPSNKPIKWMRGENVHLQKGQRQMASHAR